MSSTTTIVWFRGDLRLSDNHALEFASRAGKVVPLFIWSPDEEGEWTPGGAARWWLHHSLDALNRDLRRHHARLILRSGDALAVLQQLIDEVGATSVVWNRRYEPGAIKRDARVKQTLATQDIEVHSFNGALLHEPWTISTKTEQPYQVFTPFWKACLAADADRDPLPEVEGLSSPDSWPESDSLDDWELLPSIPWDSGFAKQWKVGARAAEENLNDFLGDRLRKYKSDRNRVDIDGFSRMSPHLHFGEISPRQIWAAVKGAEAADRSVENGAACYLSEIGWREFAYHLLYHFPSTVDEPLREKFADFPWSGSSEALERWQRGQTGFPIVDAAMRDLWATGFMPNRARMIVASFLTKDLMIPWQEGAKWFWDTLVDADLASNTLGWQWTAGCGADAAPYFRVFNPVSQGEKFDPEAAYIRKHCPELADLPAPWIYKPWEAPDDVLRAAGVELGESYPRPIVDHGEAREAALSAYNAIK